MVEKVWRQEWDKFSQDAVEEMKKYSDQTHLNREWMSYVYDVNGVYELGESSYGDESRIEVSPEAKQREDSQKNGYSASQRKWTIHGHPLKDGKIYTGRQYFSSTDILKEFINSRDNDEYVVQYVVYPHQQNNVIHNRCRILVFPNRQVVVQAMMNAHPNMTEEQVMAIDESNGYNSNASDGSLKNEAGVDWFAFQEALGEMGYMGIIDIEGPKGGRNVDAAETLKSDFIGRNSGFGIALLGIIGVLALINSGVFKKSTGITIDGFGSDFETKHNWKGD
tara:strand:+ start:1731 stop:2567 length:837 start_codon:yes stop_codon:yes gene_type:complete